MKALLPTGSFAPRNEEKFDLVQFCFLLGWTEQKNVLFRRNFFRLDNLFLFPFTFLLVYPEHSLARMLKGVCFLLTVKRASGVKINFHFRASADRIDLVLAKSIPMTNIALVLMRTISIFIFQRSVRRFHIEFGAPLRPPSRRLDM